MIRFNQIEFENLSEDIGNGTDEFDMVLYINATEDLIDKANLIRQGYGYSDIVSSNLQNPVYYDFWIDYNTTSDYMKIVFECNHGEKDDFMCYDIYVTTEEKEFIKRQMIIAMKNELLK